MPATRLVQPRHGLKEKLFHLILEFATIIVHGLDGRQWCRGLPQWARTFAVLAGRGSALAALVSMAG